MKSDVVKQGVSDLQAALASAQSDFLDSFYDKVQADLPVAGGGLSQADVDAAVAAAKAADAQALADSQAADAKALSDAQAAASASLAALQSQLDVMSAKEAAEAAVVQGLKDAVAAFQSVLASLNPPPAS